MTIFRLPQKIWKMAYIFFMRKKGFSAAMAWRWRTERRMDLATDNKIPKRIKHWAHRHGFISRRIEQYGLTRDNLYEYIPDREYYRANPINNTYGKWLDDCLSMRHILQNDVDVLPEYYYHIISRDGNPLILSLQDLPVGFTPDVSDILRLLREKRQLLFRPSNIFSFRGHYLLRFLDEKYYLNDNPLEIEAFSDFLTSRKVYYLVIEYPEQDSSFEKISGAPNILRLHVQNRATDIPVIMEAFFRFSTVEKNAMQTGYRGIPTAPVNLETGELMPATLIHDEILHPCSTHPDTGFPISGRVQGWTALKERIIQLSLRMREVEHFSVDVFLATDGSFRVFGFNPYPQLPYVGKPSKQMLKYYNDTIVYKRALPRKWWITWKDVTTLYLQIRKRFICRPGFLPYWALLWVSSLRHDFYYTKNVTLREKLWCYKRGFLSYHKAQYNLTEENWRNIISDYDYHWLSPINNRYFKWIEDKVTYRYVMESLKFFLPEYYYHIIKRQKEPKFLRMPDCDVGFSSDSEGILRLLREKENLALKPSSGTHGDGFFKISYKAGQYFINNCLASMEEIVELISTLPCYYNITEYLIMHPVLQQIYPGTVNTIRIMAINQDGKTPKIMNAYMRIATKATGLTDNVGYGGVFCHVDKKTGQFYKAEQSRNHLIVPCPVHPDTGVKIEGFIPLWEDVKECVIKMCLALPQLEYLGFDVAICENGVKVLEINKHQDLHRCSEYGEEIQAFFQNKISLKREKMNQKNRRFE